MIDKKFLQNYATKKQTSFANALREYTQHLFLRSFYTKAASEFFLFKGGTALKFVFGSPRFSEDLDFTGIKNSGKFEQVLEAALLELTTEGIQVDLIESKPTSGGHLAIIRVNIFQNKFEVHNQISFRPGHKIRPESVLISSDLVPSYSAYLLDRKKLIEEKVMALATRAKPRDFFDLYFILRRDDLRNLVQLSDLQRKKIRQILEKQDAKEIAVELKRFLPKSFWALAKELPSALKRELI